MVLVVPLLITSMISGTTANALGARPSIEPAQAFDAPLDERGGILSPGAYCRDWRQEARVRWTVTALDSGHRWTYRWRASLPSMRFPRLPVGEYRSSTAASCGGRVARQVRTLEINQKTRRGTMSRAEFQQVERGMTSEQVARVVGNGGRDPFRHDGVTTRTYDIMPFWRWSLVRYRDGRVVGKNWDVGHD